MLQTELTTFAIKDNKRKNRAQTKSEINNKNMQKKRKESSSEKEKMFTN